EFRHSTERTNSACVVAHIHFLDADRDGDIGCAGSDFQPSAAQRSHGAGAGIFDIDDRNAGDTGVLKHDLTAHALLTSPQTAERIANIGDINIGGLDTGILDGPPNRWVSQCFKRLIAETPSRVSPDANDGDFTHQTWLRWRGRICRSIR